MDASHYVAMLDQRAAEPSGTRAKSQRCGPLTTLTTMGRAVDQQDWRAKAIQEWLLLLLRFAITREPRDRSATIGMADELDSLGLQWRPSAPNFFRRTSSEVCDAIIAFDDPRRKAILKTHLARIDDPTLRGAFRAAVDLEQGSPPASSKNRSSVVANTVARGR
jgi:hypothetical protein